MIIGLLGAFLFAAHFIMSDHYPEQYGYFSHQVRAVDGLIVVVFGVVIYLIGVWRGIRKKKNLPIEKVGKDAD